MATPVLDADGRMLGAIETAIDITERKKMDEALRVKESAINSCINGIVMNDLDGRFIYANPAFLAMAGYKDGENLLGNFPSAISMNKELAQKIPPEVKEKGSWRGEDTILSKDGSKVDVEIVISLIRDEKGNPTCSMASIVDITERKRAEVEIAVISDIGRLIGSTLNIDEVYDRFAAETKKLIPFDNITIHLRDYQEDILRVAYVSGLSVDGRRRGDCLALKGSLTEVVIGTRTGLRIQSGSAEEIVGQFPGLAPAFRAGLRSIMCVPLISRDEVIGSLIFRSEKPHAYLERDLRTAERIGAQISGAIANAQLFSDLKKAENSLRESETRFRNIVETADEGIGEMNNDDQTTFVNRRLAAMLGYSPREMLSRPFTDFMFDEEHPNHELQIERRREGRDEHYERQLRRKDGTTCWALVSTTPIKNETGQVAGSFAMFTDITKRKRMEEELERHRAHLEDMVKERTKELEIKSTTLQELNTTLKVLLKQREDDKKELEERFVMNLRNLVLPFVVQMKEGRLGPGQQPLLDIIETQIHNIAAPLLKNMRQFNLTPKELKVAMLVREGKSTKKIATLLGIAAGSIDIHRKNIRNKIGLSNRRTNLQSYLQTLE